MWLAAMHTALQPVGQTTVGHCLLGGDLADGLVPTACQAPLRGCIRWGNQLKLLFRYGHADLPACRFM
jgi:hypothetical protein